MTATRLAVNDLLTISASVLKPDPNTKKFK